MRITTTLTVAFALMLTAVGCGTQAEQGTASTTTITTTTINTVEVTSPPSTTTTTTPVTTTAVTLPEGFYMPSLDPDVPCQEWTQTALDAGWSWELLPELLREVWSESRCQNVIPGHPQWNGHDHGPLQINQIWSNEVEDFFGDWSMINTPSVNFAWAWEMFKWHEHHQGCGFKPWSRKCK